MAERRALPRLLRALVLTAAFSSVVATVMPACFGRDCDASYSDWGKEANQGTLLDEDTWESSPQGGYWVDYLHERTITFWFGLALGDELTSDAQQSADGIACAPRTPDWFVGYVSTAQRPNYVNPDDPYNVEDFTIAAGNIGKYRQFGAGTLQMWNNTCSDFFVRVVVHAPPVKRLLPPGTKCVGNRVVETLADGGTAPALDLTRVGAANLADAGDAGDAAP